jgi:ADP-L-glycero-D-manno-heptose-6-epimerase
MGIKDILIVDKLRTEDKWLNIRKREYYDWMDKDNLKEWLSIKKSPYGSLFSYNRNRWRFFNG